jgi:transposase-like protein
MLNCPVCKSDKITKAGLRWRGRGKLKSKDQYYQCQGCGNRFFDKIKEETK